MLLILMFAAFLTILLVSVLILVRGTSRLRFLAFIPLGVLVAVLIGAVLFSVTFSAPFNSSFFFPAEFSQSKILVQGKALNKSESWEVSARDLESGDVLWERELSISPDIYSVDGKGRLLFEDLVVFRNVDPEDSTLMALSLKDGSVLWETNLSGNIQGDVSYQISPLLEQDGILFFSYSADSREYTALVDIRSGETLKIMDYGTTWVDLFQFPDIPILLHELTPDEGGVYSLLDSRENNPSNLFGILYPFQAAEGIYTLDNAGRLWLRNRFSGQIFMVSPHSFSSLIGEIRPALWKKGIFAGFNRETGSFEARDIFNGKVLFKVSMEKGWSPDISYDSVHTAHGLSHAPFHQIPGNNVPLILSSGQDDMHVHKIVVFNLAKENMIWSSKAFPAFNFDAYDIILEDNYYLINITITDERKSTFLCIVDSDTGEWKVFKRPTQMPYSMSYDGWSFRDGVVFGREDTRGDKGLWALDLETGEQLYTDLLKARLEPGRVELEHYLGPLP